MAAARTRPNGRLLTSRIKQSLRVLAALSRASLIVRHFSGESGGMRSSIACHRRSGGAPAGLGVAGVIVIALGTFLLGAEAVPGHAVVPC